MQQHQLFASGLILLASWILMWVWETCYKRLAISQGLWLSAALYSLHYPLHFFLFFEGLLGVLFYWMGDLELLWSVYYAIPVITFVWILINFAKKGEEVILQKRHGQIDEMNLNLAIRTLYIGIILGALFLLLPLLHVSITGLLAFGGMGAIVAGIAAKDMLANLFGGFILILDKPFRAGDWIIAPEKQLEGCVEHVGWRTTRLRSMTKQLIFVPNSIFSTVAIQNRSGCFHCLIQDTFTLRHQDSEKIASLLQEIRKYLVNHKMTNKEKTFFVYLENPSLDGLPITTRFYLHHNHFADILAIKGEVRLDILHLIRQHGADLAQTTLKMML